jgi:hypothetical protein
MNIFFEFMSMILKNHMYKVNLSILLLFKILGCSKKQNRFQVDENIEVFHSFQLMAI